MVETQSAGWMELNRTGPVSALRIGGDWTLPHHAVLATRIGELGRRVDDHTTVDLGALGALDTSGASLLHELLGGARLAALADQPDGLAPERRALLRAVAQALTGVNAPGDAITPQRSAIGDLLEHLGVATTAFWRHAVALAGFIGITVETTLRLLWRPRRWRLTAFAAQLERTALDAVPIVALLTFMVGAVVAFLGATVLTNFGAGLYTVHLVAFAFLREFGVLLAAILVAGRTASAFAAQIGSMRADEEIDAIRVIGLDPVELLVLPRVAALLLALPILTFVAMVAGMLGGLLVCNFKLDVSPAMFLNIVQNNIPLRHFFIGMAKAPIFAYLIAVIGCLEGFRVEGSAQSVGEHTTSAVVQSIFVVIVIDAVAALFCMEMRW